MLNLPIMFYLMLPMLVFNTSIWPIVSTDLKLAKMFSKIFCKSIGYCYSIFILLNFVQISIQYKMFFKIISFLGLLESVSSPTELFSGEDFYVWISQAPQMFTRIRSYRCCYCWWWCRLFTDQPIMYHVYIDLLFNKNTFCKIQIFWNYFKYFILKLPFFHSFC